MKCVRCNFKNNDNANFCYRCGSAFTDDDREKAKKTGFIGLIRKFDDFKDGITLNTKPIKILALVGIISLSAYNVYNTTSLIKLNENNEYTFTKDSDTNTYTIETTMEKVPVSLTFPSKPNELNVVKKTSEEVLEEKKYNLDEEIILGLTNENEYYDINYGKKHIYIYVTKK